MIIYIFEKNYLHTKINGTVKILDTIFILSSYFFLFITYIFYVLYKKFNEGYMDLSI